MSNGLSPVPSFVGGPATDRYSNALAANDLQEDTVTSLMGKSLSAVFVEPGTGVGTGGLT